MFYNNIDINFWSKVNIDHIDILIENINNINLTNKLEDHKKAFLQLIETPNDENFIYNNIKTHSEFINELNYLYSKNKDILAGDLYSLPHMINEGICGYRILLIIDQNKTPIPVVENLRIQELLISSSLDHLKFLKSRVNCDELVNNIDKLHIKLLKLRMMQRKVYLHFSQHGKLNKVIRFNKKIQKSSSKILLFYNNANINHKTINHIVNEEQYYVNLLERIKKSFSKS